MVFDSLISTHNSISHIVSNMEKIYIEQALKLLPTHVLSKIISEGWKIVIYSDVNELISIDNHLSANTTGVTEYEMRRVFVKGVVSGRNDIAFKTTLLHELTHVFDCIIEGSYCNWKSEKYYTNELENIILQEGNNFSEYAQSDIKEYLCTVVSRYLLNLTDFSTVPLTKAFIEKYYFMCEDSVEQRLKNLENNAVTYIELDTNYNKLKYSKLNKENDKYVIQLPEANNGGSNNNNIIYDNNVTFNTNAGYFAINKTTITYIKETINENVSGTWELKTIIGDGSAVAIQIRTFILDGRNSLTTDFTSLPNTQKRYFDYNVTRNWTSWIDCIPSLAPSEVKGILSNRIVLKATCNVARSLGAYNYYVVFKEVGNDNLYVLNYYPVTNSSNLNISDNVFYNYQTLAFLGVGGTSYVPKQPAVTKTSNKSLCSSTSGYWIENGNLKTCSSVAKLNNCLPSAKFDIICVTCRPYISSSSSNATDINIQIFAGIEESESIITENTQLTKVIDYTMSANVVADGETQTWIAEGYNFDTDILPLLVNYDTTK